MARHVYRCPLRWSDMDAFQHVNNVVFLRYLEEARIAFMFDEEAQAAGVSFAGGVVTARHEIDYLRPLVFRMEPVLVETWVNGLGAASIRLGYEVKDADSDEVYVRATSVLVPYDVDEQRPRRLTEAERDFLKGYLDERAESSGEAGDAG